MANVIETERLILRPWRDSDAVALYKYAKDPDVGMPAGWEPHKSVENSLEIIKSVFSEPYIYAVVFKEIGEPIGCCGLVPQGVRHSEMIKHGDAEIGYWLGKPYWGNGIIPEAVNALIEYVREFLGEAALWIGFFDGNDNSRRVAEKCGFMYSHTECGFSTVEHFYVRRC